ncbi:MAG: hypothetical protein ABWZ80_05480 [Beijerinckiaceae bacterium]
MHIRIIVDPLRLWGWQAKLIAALRAEGRRVDIDFSTDERRRARPLAYGLLAAFERITARGPELIYANPIEAGEFDSPRADPDAHADFVVDASGCGLSTDPDIISLLYDGASEADAMLALCAGRVPRLSLAKNGSILQEVLPAIETPRALTRSLEHLFSRALTLCRMAPRRAADAAQASHVTTPTERATFSSAAAARLAGNCVAQRLQSLLTTAPRWRTGVRRVSNDRVIDALAWPAAEYSVAPDDGRRYLADPFPVWRNGVCHLFVEEYPFATGKGVLSYATLDADGRFSPLKPALEATHHLSYPMIFERDGEVWMIPESSNARRIELYRADPFPDRWTLERVPFEDVIASDMTFLEHGGKLWLLGTLAEENGSTWDGLCAYSADSLMGEWRPHPLNPLIIDASCARPAGMAAVTARGLVRPVQDCRQRYGGALALARIDRLDEEGFEQTVIARLAPDARWKAIGVHTLNEAGGVEVVDFLSE